MSLRFLGGPPRGTLVALPGFTKHLMCSLYSANGRNSQIFACVQSNLYRCHPSIDTLPALTPSSHRSQSYLTVALLVSNRLPYNRAKVVFGRPP